ncbi:MAG: hypothetical protein EXR67_00225 [Dehalococcoidia bacterium]|nr:hypothetical protein [Dehalococcoidia bacterium]
MCSNIVEIGSIAGCGRGPDGWFDLKQAIVSFDHPVHADAEHAINIDFVNHDKGIGARVAVELTAESARELIKVLEAALARGEAEHLTMGSTAQVAR